MKRFIDENYLNHNNNNEFIYFPEEWVNISQNLPQLLIKPYYWISVYGNIFSETYNSMMTPNIDYNNKRTRICLIVEDGAMNIDIDRLMLMIFKPILEPDKYVAKHIDGNFLNNNIDNLFWYDRLENFRNSFSIGGSREHLILENSPQATLTNNEVHIICKMLEQRKSYPEICNALGKECDEKMRRKLSEIKCGTNWKAISCQYNIPKSNRNDSKFTSEQAESICEQIQNGLPNSDILKNIVGEEMFSNLNSHDRGLYYSSINNIRHKKSYKDIVNKFNF